MVSNSNLSLVVLSVFIAIVLALSEKTFFSCILFILTLYYLLTFSSLQAWMHSNTYPFVFFQPNLLLILLLSRFQQWPHGKPRKFLMTSPQRPLMAFLSGSTFSRMQVLQEGRSPFFSPNPKQMALRVEVPRCYCRSPLWPLFCAPCHFWRHSSSPFCISQGISIWEHKISHPCDVMFQQV